MSLCNTCASIRFEDMLLQKIEPGGDDYPAAFQYRELGAVASIRDRAEACPCCNWLHAILLRAHHRRPNAALYELSSGEQVQCKLENNWSSTMLGYRTAGGNDDPAIHGRERVSWLELQSYVLEQHAEYMYSNTQLVIPHAIQWTTWPPLSTSEYGKVDELEPPPGTRFTGRYVDTNTCAPSLMLKWFEICESAHGDLCQHPAWQSKLDPPRDLLLVDVHRRCVVEASPLPQYVALSYLWGKVEPLSLLKENRERLKVAGSLSVANGVPWTVEDAMQVTAMLGETYLWVDALCIVQDDKENKMKHIRQMHRVYGGAALTIVAACGVDANARLTGIGPDSRSVHQSFMRIDDLTMVSELKNINSTLEYSTWNQRGWTLQEKILSRRILRFAIDQVHWECQNDSWCEETVLETRSPSDGSRPLRGLLAETGRQYQAGHPLAAGDDEFLKYSEIVQDYTYRELSFESDILNAITGILQMLELNHNDRFVFGLPESHFDWSLLWQCNGAIRDPATSGTSFPSWSWLAWKWLILWSPELMRKPTRNPTESVITWYVLNAENEARVVSRPSPSVQSPSQANVSKGPSEWLHPDLTVGSLGGLYPVVAGVSKFIDDGRMACYTSHNKLRIRPGPVEFETQPQIVDLDGMQIGWLVWTHQPLFKEISTLGRFIVLSRRISAAIDPYQDPVVMKIEEDRSMLNVMLVDQAADSNTMKRVCVGAVFEDAWSRLSPTWEFTIIS